MAKTKVSLCYDGGRPTHLTRAFPDLASFDLKATFFVDPRRLLTDLSAWRTVLAAGHEIGNGTLLASALPDGSLPSFGIDSVLEDLLASNRFLEEVFSIGDPSIALPMGESKCAEGSYLEVVLSRFHTVRTGQFGVNHLEHRPRTIRCVPASGLSGGQLIDVVRSAVQTPAWVVLAFDVIGDRGTTERAHHELLQYLASSKDLVTVATFSDAATLTRNEVKNHPEASPDKQG